MVPKYSLPGKIDFKSTLGRPVTDLDEAPISIDDLAFLQYTGATTGLSKGAMLSHGNVIASLEQLEAMLVDVI